MSENPLCRGAPCAEYHAAFNCSPTDLVEADRALARRAEGTASGGREIVAWCTDLREGRELRIYQAGQHPLTALHLTPQFLRQRDRLGGHIAALQSAHLTAAHRRVNNNENDMAKRIFDFLRSAVNRNEHLVAEHPIPVRRLTRPLKILERRSRNYFPLPRPGK